MNSTYIIKWAKRFEDTGEVDARNVTTFTDNELAQKHLANLVGVIDNGDVIEPSEGRAFKIVYAAIDVQGEARTKFNSDYPDWVTNMAGQRFDVGDRVRHNDGWYGTVVCIRRPYRGATLLHVEPEDYSKLPPFHNRELKNGRWYIKARDHGQSMGNFTPMAELEQD